MRSPFRYLAIGGKAFPVYASMLYVGLVVALCAGDLLARRMGLDPSRVVLAMLLHVPICLAGARGFVVLLHWRHFRRRLGEILRVNRGGAAMYGALPPALLLSIPITRWLDIPFATFWDIGAVAILAGMIPTRFGCLGAGCCAGRPVKSAWWGMSLRNPRGERERRVPSPLLEALLGAALLGALLALWERLPFPGAAFLFAVGGYAAGRFALEGLREDRGPMWRRLGVFQWASAALVVICAAGLAAGLALPGEGGPRAELATLSAGASTSGAAARVTISALLLLPVIRLFRFLGCSLLFLEASVTKHLFRMGAVVPDLGGTGGFSATLELLLEPDLDEVEESPVEFAPAGSLPDGRLIFEALQEIPEGAYQATCTVAREGAVTRLGSCSGELTGPGLALVFTASDSDAPNILNPTFCFVPEDQLPT